MSLERVPFPLGHLVTLTCHHKTPQAATTRKLLSYFSCFTLSQLCFRSFLTPFKPVRIFPQKKPDLPYCGTPWGAGGRPSDPTQVLTHPPSPVTTGKTWSHRELNKHQRLRCSNTQGHVPAHVIAAQQSCPAQFALPRLRWTADKAPPALLLVHHATGHLSLWG